MPEDESCVESNGDGSDDESLEPTLFCLAVPAG